MYKNVADTFSHVGTDKGAVVVDGDIVKLQIIGTTLKAFVNGV